MITLIILFILFALSGCVSGNRQQSVFPNSNVNLLQIDNAIEMAGEKISFGLPDKTAIAIVNIASNEQGISEYIVNELASVIVNHQKLTTLSRQKILDIQEELQFNMSGNISDNTAQRIGHMIGASSIVSGSLTRISNNYRLNIQVLKTETAEIQLAFSYDIINDSRLVGLTTNTANSNTIPNVQNPLGDRGVEWNEQDGYAIVNGENYHYWLYSTESFCKYHKWNKNIIGNSTDDQLSILLTALENWVENNGWTIDYENIWLSDPNEGLAVSVKRLMATRGQDFGILNLNSVYMDVSATLVTRNAKEATLYVNYWNFMKEDYYRTWGYPLIKF